MTDSPIVAQGRKFGQVIRGAATIFLRDGYAGASVDDIAQAAQVSKATLYSYFADKSHMFQEAMRAEIALLDGSFRLDIDEDLDPERAIPVITARISGWLADPARIGLYRLHVAEAPRFGALSRHFHDRLVQTVHDGIRPHLDRWVRSGQLCLTDTRIAARQLVALSGAGLTDPLLLHGRASPSAAEIRAVSRSAAQLFLRAALPRRPDGLRGTGVADDANVTAGPPSQAPVRPVSSAR